MIEYNIANILALENFEKESVTDFADDIERIIKNLKSFLDYHLEI